MNAYQIPADPTAVVGRRIGAFAINAVILGAALFLGARLADFKSEEIPAGFSDSLGDQSVCDVVEENSDISQCFELNDTVYYTDTSGAAIKFWAPWLIVFVVNHVVIAGVAGGSIGKLAVGLRVVKKDTGQIAGIGPAIIRSVLWIVDAVPYCFPLVALITVLTTKGHRRVGDMAAGTLVVPKEAVGRPPLVPGLTSPAMAAPGGYAAPPPGPGWAPPAPTWGTPPPPTQDPWSSPPPPAAAPDPWSPPAPSYQPPAPSYEPPAPVPSVEPPTPSWEQPAPVEEPATSAYPAAPAWDAPAPAESTVLSPSEPEPEPTPAPAWEPAPAPSPAWEPRTVLAPEPEPEPEPAPVAEAAPAATETPGVGAPMWDAARNAYIQWDPSVGSWMQWDDAAAQWRPIS